MSTMKTNHKAAAQATADTANGGITLREFASVPSPSPKWTSTMIAQVIANPQLHGSRLMLTVEWLQEQWSQFRSQQVVVVVQPRLAMAGTMAAVFLAVVMWHSSSQWSIADNLEYFASTLISDEIYDLDWSN